MDEDKKYKILLILSWVVSFLGYGFLIFLSVINEIFRAMLISTVVGLAGFSLYAWYRIKKILKEEE